MHFLIYKFFFILHLGSVRRRRYFWHLFLSLIFLVQMKWKYINSNVVIVVALNLLFQLFLIIPINWTYQWWLLHNKGIHIDNESLCVFNLLWLLRCADYCYLRSLVEFDFTICLIHLNLRCSMLFSLIQDVIWFRRRRRRQRFIFIPIFLVISIDISFDVDKKVVQLNTILVVAIIWELL